MIYIYTKKQLNRLYPKPMLDKYENQLAFLYQNGFKTDCRTVEDFEEQIDLFNGLDNEESLKEVRKLTNIVSDYEIGKNILIEEFYDIAKKCAFCRNETESIVVIKTLVTSNLNNIKNTLNRLKDIFNSEYSEVIGFAKTLDNYSDFLKRIEDIEGYINRDIKLLTWRKFIDLINIVYSTYIKYGKVITESNKIVINSNLNTEIYGAIGGYNPLTKEVKTMMGGAVYDLKNIFEGNTVKVKTMANTILKDYKNEEDDDDNIKFLKKWVKGTAFDNETAKRVVINCLLNGILTLLSLKHKISFIEDKKNEERKSLIKDEFVSIMNYCGINKRYLL